MTYCVNNFLNQYTIDNIIDKLLPDINDLDDSCNYCIDLFNNNILIDDYDESKLQQLVILPIINRLGWNCLSEEIKIISGVQQKLEAILFSDKNMYDTYNKINKSQRSSYWDGIDIILESKTSKKELDTKKAAKQDNPYIQLLVHLQSSEINRGFLTNGRQWYFVDSSWAVSGKSYIAFQLDKIIADGKRKEFDFFWRLFHADNFKTAAGNIPPRIDQICGKDRERRREIENDLKAAICGSEGNYSLFEEIGRAVHASDGSPSGPDRLKKVFENSLYFIFRLIFIACFEDRCKDIIDRHPGYNSVSLRALRDEIRPDSEICSGWLKLKNLFTVLDEGDLSLKISRLDGSLFDPAKTPLLSGQAVFNDQTLAGIFEALFKMGKGGEKYDRDFAVLSPSHLGTIYEGLLELEFRLADENMAYAVICDNNKKNEGYCYESDLSKINNQQKGVKVTTIRAYNKNDLYLVNSNNSRKTSGSYYTPESLAVPLAAGGLKLQLEGQFKDHSIADLRILDCACGSGHLLAAALNILTNTALERLESDSEKELKELLTAETASINSNYLKMNLAPDSAGADEITVLKRILLKKTIYGADLSPFAAELAKMSLWLDTFIFGTPLCFIEHHIKCGHSLIGTDISSLAKKTEAQASDIFENQLNSHLEAIRANIISLNDLNDTAKDDINHLKRIYYDTILPKINKLTFYCNLATYLDFLSLQGVSPLPAVFFWFDPENEFKIRPEKAELLAELESEAEKYRAEFGFFNWEAEFPDVFSLQNFQGPGFHLIIGNPPWDKTKFEEPLFFSQYRADYRKQSNSQKKKIAADLLADPAVKTRYDHEKQKAALVNEYLKVNYPASRGSGDGNLFRFFTEKALSLLAPGGSLNYILPTGLLTEDGSACLRHHIFENFRINSFDGFENRLGIFPDIHRSYKFGLIQIENTADPTQKSNTRFMLTDPSVLKTDNNKFEYSLDDVKITSPKHQAYLEVSGGKEALMIQKKIYSKFSALDPIWLDFRNELHATDDKSIFKEKFKSGYIPLYKGAMIWQYEAQAGEAKYWLDPNQLDGYLMKTQISRLKSGLKFQFSKDKSLEAPILNFLKQTADEDLLPYILPERNYFRLAFRAVASDTNERTLVSALLPKNISSQNSLWLSVPGRYFLNFQKKMVEFEEIPLARLLFTQAVFNSLTLDWILRASVAVNVNKTYIYRLPLPQPSDLELSNDPVCRNLIRNSALLSLYHSLEALAEIKTLLNIQDHELLKTDKAFELKKSELEIKIARLYGLNSADFAHILSSFIVLKKKKPSFVLQVLNLSEQLP